MLLRRDDAGALFLLPKAQFDALKGSKAKLSGRFLYISGNFSLFTFHFSLFFVSLSRKQE